MKTATVNGKSEKISYRTNTAMYTRMSKEGFKTAQYGADVYNVDNNSDFIVLVATAQDGGAIQSTTTVIAVEEYEKIVDLHDVYNEFPYHAAILEKLGFE